MNPCYLYMVSPRTKDPYQEKHNKYIYKHTLTRSVFACVNFRGLAILDIHAKINLCGNLSH